MWVSNTHAKYKIATFVGLNTEEIYMQRCLELAVSGLGSVSPNPMVGCVIVHHGTIIGEGWHRKYGEAHAEVNAIHSVADKSLLPESTVYVNLEPCSHFGKTPPCADLLISYRVKKVVIGMMDPFEKVAGSGIQKLKDAGIEVQVGVMEEACRELNKRFITFNTQRRPYVILKWAQTINGFIAPDAAKMSAEEFEQKRHITGLVVQRLVHKWRSEEDAIMVGTNTIITDNPALNTRAWGGKNPVRITLDLSNRLPANLKIFDGSQPSIIFSTTDKKPANNLEYISIDKEQPVFTQMLHALYERHIQSLIVEGGTITLNHILAFGLWDEAQVFVSPQTLEDGIAAPKTPNGKVITQTTIDSKQLTIYRNHL